MKHHNLQSIFVILIWIEIKRIYSFQYGSGLASLSYRVIKQRYHHSPIFIHASNNNNVIPEKRYGHSKSLIFASSPFWMDDFLDENDNIPNTDISYLKFINLRHLPSGTETILKKVTKAYIESDVKKEDNIHLVEVLDMIDAEYKYYHVPFLIANNTISFESTKQKSVRNSQEAAHTIVSKVLSFAALHRLPHTVAMFLFGDLLNEKNIDSETKEEIVSLLKDFIESGWDCVEFKQGLSIRMKRDFIVSRRSRYYPLPRKSIFTRSQDALDAAKALDEAMLVKPPMKLIKQQEIEKEINLIENELSIQSELSQRSSIRDMLPFFPNKERLISRFVKATTKPTSKYTKPRSKIRALGRAGFISYCLLSFIWYTCSIFWQWYRFTDSQSNYLVQGNIDAIKRSLRKFSKIFVSTYFNPQLTKFHRFAIAFLLAPLGHRALTWTQNKLKIEPDQAVGFISSLVVILSILVWGLIILGDVTFSKSSMGTFAM